VLFLGDFSEQKQTNKANSKLWKLLSLNLTMNTDRGSDLHIKKASKVYKQKIEAQLRKCKCQAAKSILRENFTFFVQLLFVLFIQFKSVQINLSLWGKSHSLSLLKLTINFC